MEILYVFVQLLEIQDHSPSVIFLRSHKDWRDVFLVSVMCFPYHSLSNFNTSKSIAYICSVKNVWLCAGFSCTSSSVTSVSIPSTILGYNTTLLPSVNTVARGMFCRAKYTHHTFTPIIKHYITKANKHPGKKWFIDKNINPTDIKLCISHKIATSRGPPLQSYCPNKSNYRNYLLQIN